MAKYNTNCSVAFGDDYPNLIFRLTQATFFKPAGEFIKFNKNVLDKEHLNDPDKLESAIFYAVYDRLNKRTTSDGEPLFSIRAISEIASDVLYLFYKKYNFKLIKADSDLISKAVKIRAHDYTTAHSQALTEEERATIITATERKLNVLTNTTPAEIIPPPESTNAPTPPTQQRNPVDIGNITINPTMDIDNFMSALSEVESVKLTDEDATQVITINATSKGEVKLTAYKTSQESETTEYKPQDFLNTYTGFKNFDPQEGRRNINVNELRADMYAYTTYLPKDLLNLDVTTDDAIARDDNNNGTVTITSYDYNNEIVSHIINKKDFSTEVQKLRAEGHYIITKVDNYYYETNNKLRELKNEIENNTTATITLQTLKGGDDIRVNKTITVEGETYKFSYITVIYDGHVIGTLRPPQPNSSKEFLEKYKQLLTQLENGNELTISLDDISKLIQPRQAAIAHASNKTVAANLYGSSAGKTLKLSGREFVSMLKARGFKVSSLFVDTQSAVSSPITSGKPVIFYSIFEDNLDAKFKSGALKYNPIKRSESVMHAEVSGPLELSKNDVVAMYMTERVPLSFDDLLEFFENHKSYRRFNDDTLDPYKKDQLMNFASSYYWHINLAKTIKELYRASESSTFEEFIEDNEYWEILDILFAPRHEFSETYISDNGEHLSSDEFKRRYVNNIKEEFENLGLQFKELEEDETFYYFNSFSQKRTFKEAGNAYTYYAAVPMEFGRKFTRDGLFTVKRGEIKKDEDRSNDTTTYYTVTLELEPRNNYKKYLLKAVENYFGDNLKETSTPNEINQQKAKSRNIAFRLYGYFGQMAKDDTLQAENAKRKQIKEKLVQRRNDFSIILINDASNQEKLAIPRTYDGGIFYNEIIDFLNTFIEEDGVKNTARAAWKEGDIQLTPNVAAATYKEKGEDATPTSALKSAGNKLAFAGPLFKGDTSRDFTLDYLVTQEAPAQTHIDLEFDDITESSTEPESITEDTEEPDDDVEFSRRAQIADISVEDARNKMSAHINNADLLEGIPKKIQDAHKERVEGMASKSFERALIALNTTNGKVSERTLMHEIFHAVLNTAVGEDVMMEVLDEWADRDRLPSKIKEHAEKYPPTEEGLAMFYEDYFESFENKRLRWVYDLLSFSELVSGVFELFHRLYLKLTGQYSTLDVFLTNLQNGRYQSSPTKFNHFGKDKIRFKRGEVDEKFIELSTLSNNADINDRLQDGMEIAQGLLQEIDKFVLRANYGYATVSMAGFKSPLDIIKAYLEVQADSIYQKHRNDLKKVNAELTPTSSLGEKMATAKSIYDKLDTPHKKLVKIYDNLEFVINYIYPDIDMAETLLENDGELNVDIATKNELGNVNYSDQKAELTIADTMSQRVKNMLYGTINPSKTNSSAVYKIFTQVLQEVKVDITAEGGLDSKDVQVSDIITLLKKKIEELPKDSVDSEAAKHLYRRVFAPTVPRTKDHLLNRVKVRLKSGEIVQRRKSASLYSLGYHPEIHLFVHNHIEAIAKIYNEGGDTALANALGVSNRTTSVEYLANKKLVELYNAKDYTKIDEAIANVVEQHQNAFNEVLSYFMSNERTTFAKISVGPRGKFYIAEKEKADSRIVAEVKEQMIKKLFDSDENGFFLTEEGKKTVNNDLVKFTSDNDKFKLTLSYTVDGETKSHTISFEEDDLTPEHLGDYRDFRVPKIEALIKKLEDDNEITDFAIQHLSNLGIDLDARVINYFKSQHKANGGIIVQFLINSYAGLAAEVQDLQDNREARKDNKILSAWAHNRWDNLARLSDTVISAVFEEVSLSANAENYNRHLLGPHRDREAIVTKLANIAERYMTTSKQNSFYDRDSRKSYDQFTTSTRQAFNFLRGLIKRYKVEFSKLKKETGLSSSAAQQFTLQREFNKKLAHKYPYLFNADGYQNALLVPKLEEQTFVPSIKVEKLVDIQNVDNFQTGAYVKFSNLTHTDKLSIMFEFFNRTATDAGYIQFLENQADRNKALGAKLSKKWVVGELNGTEAYKHLENIYLSRFNYFANIYKDIRRAGGALDALPNDFMEDINKYIDAVEKALQDKTLVDKLAVNKHYKKFEGRAILDPTLKDDLNQSLDEFVAFIKFKALETGVHFKKYGLHHRHDLTSETKAKANYKLIDLSDESPTSNNIFILFNNGEIIKEKTKDGNVFTNVDDTIPNKITANGKATIITVDKNAEDLNKAIEDAVTKAKELVKENKDKKVTIPETGILSKGVDEAFVTVLESKLGQAFGYDPEITNVSDAFQVTTMTTREAKRLSIAFAKNQLTDDDLASINSMFNALSGPIKNFSVNHFINGFYLGQYIDGEIYQYKGLSRTEKVKDLVKRITTNMTPITKFTLMHETLYDPEKPQLGVAIIAPNGLAKEAKIITVEDEEFEFSDYILETIAAKDEDGNFITRTIDDKTYYVDKYNGKLLKPIEAWDGVVIKSPVTTKLLSSSTGESGNIYTADKLVLNDIDHNKGEAYAIKGLEVELNNWLLANGNESPRKYIKAMYEHGTLKDRTTTAPILQPDNTWTVSGLKDGVEVIKITANSAEEALAEAEAEGLTLIEREKTLYDVYVENGAWLPNENGEVTEASHEAVYKEYVYNRLYKSLGEDIAAFITPKSSMKKAFPNVNKLDSGFEKSITISMENLGFILPINKPLKKENDVVIGTQMTYLQGVGSFENVISSIEMFEELGKLIDAERTSINEQIERWKNRIDGSALERDQKAHAKWVLNSLKEDFLKANEFDIRFQIITRIQSMSHQALYNDFSSKLPSKWRRGFSTRAHGSKMVQLPAEKVIDIAYEDGKYKLLSETNAPTRKLRYAHLNEAGELLPTEVVSGNLYTKKYSLPEASLRTIFTARMQNTDDTGNITEEMFDMEADNFEGIGKKKKDIYGIFKGRNTLVVLKGTVFFDGLNKLFNPTTVAPKNLESRSAKKSIRDFKASLNEGEKVLFEQYQKELNSEEIITFDDFIRDAKVASAEDGLYKNIDKRWKKALREAIRHEFVYRVSTVNKSLYGVMTRIPTTGKNSSTFIRTVAFHTDYGNAIFVPGEWLYISGSDYDGDTLQVMTYGGNDFTKANNVLDKVIKILKDPKNLPETHKQLAMDEILEYAEQENKDIYLHPYFPIDWSFIHEGTQAGKGGVAINAIIGKTYSYALIAKKFIERLAQLKENEEDTQTAKNAQSYLAKIAGNVIPLPSGTDNEATLISPSEALSFKASDGAYVHEWLETLINAAVDNTKHLALGAIKINRVNSSIVAALTFMGHSSTTIINFLTSPIVQSVFSKVVEKLNIAPSSVRSGIRKSVTSFNVLREYLKSKGAMPDNFDIALEDVKSKIKAAEDAGTVNELYNDPDFVYSLLGALVFFSENYNNNSNALKVTYEISGKLSDRTQRIDRVLESMQFTNIEELESFMYELEEKAINKREELEGVKAFADEESEAIKKNIVYNAALLEMNKVKDFQGIASPILTTMSHPHIREYIQNYLAYERVSRHHLIFTPAFQRVYKYLKSNMNSNKMKFGFNRRRLETVIFKYIDGMYLATKSAFIPTTKDGTIKEGSNGRIYDLSSSIERDEFRTNLAGYIATLKRTKEDAQFKFIRRLTVGRDIKMLYSEATDEIDDKALREEFKRLPMGIQKLLFYYLLSDNRYGMNKERNSYFKFLNPELFVDYDNYLVRTENEILRFENPNIEFASHRVPDLIKPANIDTSIGLFFKALMNLIKDKPFNTAPVSVIPYGPKYADSYTVPKNVEINKFEYDEKVLEEAKELYNKLKDYMDFSMTDKSLDNVTKRKNVMRILSQISQLFKDIPTKGIPPFQYRDNRSKKGKLEYQNFFMYLEPSEEENTEILERQFVKVLGTNEEGEKLNRATNTNRFGTGFTFNETREISHKTRNIIIEDLLSSLALSNINIYPSDNTEVNMADLNDVAFYSTTISEDTKLSNPELNSLFNFLAAKAFSSEYAIYLSKSNDPSKFIDDVFDKFMELFNVSNVGKDSTLGDLAAQALGLDYEAKLNSLGMDTETFNKLPKESQTLIKDFLNTNDVNCK